MSIKEMAIAWLKTNGYDGLYLDDDCEGCGCGIDDLMPCDNCDSENCKAGYMHKDSQGIWYGSKREEKWLTDL